MAKLPAPPQFIELSIGGEVFTVRTFSKEPLFDGTQLTYEVQIEIHPDDAERMQAALERENG